MNSIFNKDQKHKLIDKEIPVIEIKKCKEKKVITKVFNQMINLLDNSLLLKQDLLSKI